MCFIFDLFVQHSLCVIMWCIFLNSSTMSSIKFVPFLLKINKLFFKDIFNQSHNLYDFLEPSRKEDVKMIFHISLIDEICSTKKVFQRLKIIIICYIRWLRLELMNISTKGLLYLHSADWNMWSTIILMENNSILFSKAHCCTISIFHLLLVVVEK